MKKPPLFSLFLEKSFKLPQPVTRDLEVQEDLQIPMRDGAVLLADRWAPASGGDGLPVALMRGPYGRRGLMAAQIARPLAERGFQVVLQSARGTFGSSGDFDPLRQERLDGIDTVEWLVEQPWFGDGIVLAGSSYQGYAQWAIGDALRPEVRALVPAMTESTLGVSFMPPAPFALESVFGWGVMIEQQEERHAMMKFLLGRRRRNRAQLLLPLSEAGPNVLGRHSPLIEGFLTDDATSPDWVVTDHSARVADVAVPVSIVSGWYDVFLSGTLRDYRNLLAADRPARLTIGPWSHASPQALGVMMEETVGFGLAHARGDVVADRAPVRAFVTGAEEWRDLDTWPPPGYEDRAFHLHAEGALDVETSADAGVDRYRYDPADPTPAAGGRRMLPGVKAMGVDNAKLEARPDVLIYTSDVLTSDTEVLGEASARIWFRSSLAHADVFVRVCDVDPKGRSVNLCDGLTRVEGADVLQPIDVSLVAMGHVFKRGHRIRLQVSSGAFPQFARNLGTDEPRLTATTLRAADQEVHHGPDQPSAVRLPVRAEVF